MRAESKPQQEFVFALRSEIMKKAGDAHLYEPTPIFKYALAPLTLSLLLGVGTASYAFASPSVSEGHMLYPLKSGVETVEGAFYRTPEAKAYYRVKVLQRRVDEAGYVIEHGAPTIIYLERIPSVYDLTAQEIKAIQKLEAQKEEQRHKMESDAADALKLFRLKVERAPMDEHDRSKLLGEIDRRLEILGE